MHPAESARGTVGDVEMETDASSYPRAILSHSGALRTPTNAGSFLWSPFSANSDAKGKAMRPPHAQLPQLPQRGAAVRVDAGRLSTGSLSSISPTSTGLTPGSPSKKRRLATSPFSGNSSAAEFDISRGEYEYGHRSQPQHQQSQPHTSIDTHKKYGHHPGFGSPRDVNRGESPFPDPLSTAARRFFEGKEYHRAAHLLHSALSPPPDVFFSSQGEKERDNMANIDDANDEGAKYTSSSASHPHTLSVEETLTTEPVLLYTLSPECSPQSLFILFYAQYMAGEKSKVDASAVTSSTTTGPAPGTSSGPSLPPSSSASAFFDFSLTAQGGLSQAVSAAGALAFPSASSNPHLGAINSAVESLLTQGPRKYRSDPFLLYLRALLLANSGAKALPSLRKTAMNMLIRSLRAFPLNWSAWGLLADLFQTKRELLGMDLSYHGDETNHEQMSELEHGEQDCQNFNSPEVWDFFVRMFYALAFQRLGDSEITPENEAPDPTPQDAVEEENEDENEHENENDEDESAEDQYQHHQRLNGNPRQTLKQDANSDVTREDHETWSSTSFTRSKNGGEMGIGEAIVSRLPSVPSASSFSSTNARARPHSLPSPSPSSSSPVFVPSVPSGGKLPPRSLRSAQGRLLLSLYADFPVPSVALYLGSLHFRAREFGLAEAVFSAVSSADPFSLPALTHLSHILFLREEAGELADLARRAFAAQRFHPLACIVAGNYYGAKGMSAQALAYFLRAVRLDPGASEAWLLAGHELRQTRNPRSALEAYRRAQSLSPLDPRVVFAVALTYEAMGLLSHALYYYQRTVALNPFDARYWTSYAHALLKSGDLPRATQAFWRAETCTESAEAAGDLGNAGGALTGVGSDGDCVALVSLAEIHERTGEHALAASIHLRHLERRVLMKNPLLVTRDDEDVGMSMGAGRIDGVGKGNRDALREPRELEEGRLRGIDLTSVSLKGDDEVVRSLVYLGQYYSRDGDWKKATVCFSVAASNSEGKLFHDLYARAQEARTMWETQIQQGLSPSVR